MKRNTLSMTGLLTLAVSLAVLCLPAGGGVIKICIVGNSMTIPNKAKSYPARLQEMMGDGYEIINSAVNGRTVIAHGPYPYVEEDAFKEIFTHKPHIIAIMLGTNDSKTMHWKDSADFEPDYRMLVDSLLTIRTSPPDGGPEMTPKMFLCYPPKVQVDCWKCGGKHNIRDPILKNYVQPIIDSIAKDKNLEVIDTYTPFIGKEDLYRDNLHFNADGYQYMAEFLQPILTKVKFTQVKGCTSSTYLKYDSTALKNASSALHK